MEKVDFLTFSHMVGVTGWKISSKGNLST